MSDLSAWSILIVEDEPDSMEVVKDILDHHNIENYGASTAEEALDLLETVTPTLVIVDLALPMMDGWELLSELQTRPATTNIPAIAVTAYHSVNVAQKAIEAGFHAYFPKPIEATSFVRELERVV